MNIIVIWNIVILSLPSWQYFCFWYFSNLFLWLLLKTACWISQSCLCTCLWESCNKCFKDVCCCNQWVDLFWFDLQAGMHLKYWVEGYLIFHTITSLWSITIMQTMFSTEGKISLMESYSKRQQHWRCKIQATRRKSAQRSLWCQIFLLHENLASLWYTSGASYLPACTNGHLLQLYLDRMGLWDQAQQVISVWDFLTGFWVWHGTKIWKHITALNSSDHLLWPLISNGDSWLFGRECLHY